MRSKIFAVALTMIAGVAPAAAADLGAYPHYKYRPPVAEAVTPYYFVNQGPTYTGPGNVVMMPIYRERSAYSEGGYSAPYYDYSYRDGPYSDPLLIPYHHPVHLYGYGPVVRAMN